MFANQKCGPLHNSSTCVQCIPQMPAEVVPYQSLQLFWCVAQRPPCPPLHRAGMCSLWDSRLWERPPRCPAPPPLHSTICELFNETWKISHQQLCLLSPRKLVATRQQLQGHFTNREHQREAWCYSLASNNKSDLNCLTLSFFVLFLYSVEGNLI